MRGIAHSGRKSAAAAVAIRTTARRRELVAAINVRYRTLPERLL